MDNIMVFKSKLSYEKIKTAMRELSTIQYSIIKGEPLSVAAYNKVGRRTSSDIDILTSRKNLHIIEKKILEHGFKRQHFNNATEQRVSRALMLSNSHQTNPFYRQEGAFVLSVDLNFDIFWGEYIGKRVDIDEFIFDAIEINIYGVKVKVLPPLKAMVQLILHHYKDMNSIFLLATRKSIKYTMFKDVYFLLKNNISEISLPKLHAICSKYEIIPYVYYIFYHTNLLFDDTLLKEYISAFKTAEGEELLNCYGLNQSERKEWKYNFDIRLKSASLYDLIKDDLTQKDREKIEINKKIFRSE